MVGITTKHTGGLRVIEHLRAAMSGALGGDSTLSIGGSGSGMELALAAHVGIALRDVCENRP